MILLRYHTLPGILTFARIVKGVAVSGKWEVGTKNRWEMSMVGGGRWALKNGGTLAQKPGMSSVIRLLSNIVSAVYIIFHVDEI